MENVKYKFEFNFLEINTLLKGCRELPYKETAGLIQQIINEYTKQAQENELALKQAPEVTAKEDTEAK